MKCRKCGGIMNPEEFISATKEGAGWTYEGWRCVYCGEVIDPLIIENRMREQERMKKDSLTGSGKGHKTALCRA